MLDIDALRLIEKELNDSMKRLATWDITSTAREANMERPR